MKIVRVAAAQVTPVILDAEGCIAKAIEVINEAASRDIELVVFPEAFVPLYPSQIWASSAATFSGADELWRRLWENSLEVPGPVIQKLASACAKADIHCVIGINERDAVAAGTLYNSLVLIGPAGLLWRHRKIMPTHHERLFHGFGDGQDLCAVDTPFGRVGGLICWENRMPLARYLMHESRPQLWAAPTADDTDGWLATVRHVALESGAFVISVPQFIPRAAFGEDFPAVLPSEEVYGRGGAAIIEPTGGEVIAGPLYNAEGLVVADCDLGLALQAKRLFDVTGHYSRVEILARQLCAASDGARSSRGRAGAG